MSQKKEEASSSKKRPFYMFQQQEPNPGLKRMQTMKEKDEGQLFGTPGGMNDDYGDFDH